MNAFPFCITSAANPRVRHLIRLRRGAHRARAEQIVIEGAREIRRALEAGIRVETLFVCPEHAQRPDDLACLEQAAALGIERIACTPMVFAKLALRGSTEGLIALATPPRCGLDALTLRAEALLVVAESVEKPGNLGALLRNADAAAADAVLVCDGRTDPFNPNAIRASLGAVFTLPVIPCAPDEALAYLRRQAVRIVAATPEGDGCYTEADLTGPIAVVVGSEALGLQPFWLHAADQRVRIPMLGRVDSLNVATAAALLMFEAVRQRGALACGVKPFL